MKQFDLEEYLKNPERKVVTRDGKDVRIICTDRVAEDYTLLALVMTGNQEDLYSYTANGQFCTVDTNNVLDLFFAPEKREGWVNIYKAAVPRKTLGCSVTRYAGSVIYPTEVAAKAAADADPIATIKIEWEE